MINFWRIQKNDSVKILKLSFTESTQDQDESDQ